MVQENIPNVLAGERIILYSEKRGKIREIERRSRRKIVPNRRFFSIAKNCLWKSSSLS